MGPKWWGRGAERRRWSMNSLSSICALAKAALVKGRKNLNVERENCGAEEI